LDVVAPEPAVDVALIAREQSDHALAALNRLPEPLRAVTALHYIGGHSVREISDFLGVPANTVKTRLHRARSRLAERALGMAKDTLDQNRPSRNDTFVAASELARAAVAGDIAAVTTLLAERPELVHGADRYGDRALAHAAGHGRLDVARLLLSRGASVDAARSGKDEGWSALFGATGWGAREDMVALLLDHGANVLARAQHHGAADDSCLHNACRHESNGPIVSLLLSRGGRPLLAARCGDGDSRDDGYTPLHVAVKRGFGEIARTLLDSGAELDAFSAAGLGMSDWLAGRDTALDATDANGWTPLHWAASCGREDTAEYLLERKAPLDARDRYGRAPVHHAILTGHDALTHKLVACGAALDDFANAALGHAGAVESTTAQDAFGWTSLHWACRAGQTDAARALLDRGADPNATDSEGRPPLFIAAYNARHLPSVQALLDAGADPKVRDAFDCGLLAYDTGREIGRVLRDLGATD